MLFWRAMTMYPRRHSPGLHSLSVWLGEINLPTNLELFLWTNWRPLIISSRTNIMWRSHIFRTALELLHQQHTYVAYMLPRSMCWHEQLTVSCMLWFLAKRWNLHQSLAIVVCRRVIVICDTNVWKFGCGESRIWKERKRRAVIRTLDFSFTVFDLQCFILLFAFVMCLIKRYQKFEKLQKNRPVKLAIFWVCIATWMKKLEGNTGATFGFC